MTDTTPPANLAPAEVAEWQAACAATPGPYTTTGTVENKWRVRVGTASLADREMFADARNIATNADPTTVRARLREISELRGQVAALTAERERLRRLIVEYVEAASELAEASSSGTQDWHDRAAIREQLAWQSIEHEAAVRTNAGTARLDTEGENDGK